jgi:hypothetical protein
LPQNLGRQVCEVKREASLSHKLKGVPTCQRYRRWPSDVTAAQVHYGYQGCMVLGGHGLTVTSVCVCVWYFGNRNHGFPVILGLRILSYLPTPQDVPNVPPDHPKRTASTPRHPRTCLNVTLKYRHLRRNGRCLPTLQDVPKVSPDTPGRTQSTSRHPRRTGRYRRTLK